MSLELEKILGTDRGKEAFYKADRNFTKIENKINNMDASGDAENISYDNTASEMTAENVQDAIDELNQKIEDNSTSGNAIDIIYDNVESELEATNVQAAIDELRQQNNDLDAEVVAHKAETVSELVIVTRDLTLTGNQIVGGFSKKSKRIDIITALNNQNKYCFGYLTSNNQTAIQFYPSSLVSATTGKSISIGDSPENSTIGTVVVNADNTITITWSKVGTGGTGTAAIRLVAHYHD